MSGDRTDDAPPALAAEYALGLLTGGELRAAASRVDTDPTFANEVARWRGRLAPLHTEITEAVPPDSVWQGIDSALFGPNAANDNVQRLRRRVAVWRAATAAMTTIAASLAIVLLWHPLTTLSPQSPAERSPSAPMVAMLGDDRAMKVVASWDPNSRQLVLAIPGDMRADPAHSHELWVIPPGGKPRSLGTMASGKQMHMRLAEAIATLLQQGATIAISVEPLGGSPTGKPTGQVVASGALHTA